MNASLINCVYLAIFFRNEDSEALQAQLLQLQTRSSSGAHKTVLSPPRVSEAEMYACYIISISLYLLLKLMLTYICI